MGSNNLENGRFGRGVLLGLCLLTSLGFRSISYAGSSTGVKAGTSSRPILFVRKAGPSFEKVFSMMSRDLKKYLIKDMVVTNETSYSEFEKEVNATNPRLLVLMDNRSVELGDQWNRQASTKIPGIALMALNLSTVLKDNKYIAGIAYESPAYTLLTQYRYATSSAIKNVLVFYRKSLFSEIVAETGKQLKRENITLHAVDVEEGGKDKIVETIKQKVPEYLKSEKYDALWVMLDSALLSKQLFTEVWLPSARQSKIPLLTGVEQLVLPALSFGVFAVTPNLEDLSGQGVQIVEKMLEENLSPSAIGVEPVISVDKVINKIKVKDLGISLDEQKLTDVKVLQ